MTIAQLHESIKVQSQFLCVGLDPDLTRLPKHLPKSADGVVEFLRQIILATEKFCVSYKVNFAFFEALGVEGWDALYKVRDFLPPSHFLIADAKRGDIGNTAKHYAQSIFDSLDFDAVTLNPYMGRDVLEPFLMYKDKVSIILGLTSNQGSQDYQLLKTESGHYLYEEIINISSNWGSADQLMYVVGATQEKHLNRIRSIIPDHFLLVPGVGAQGGSLHEVYAYGHNAQTGLLINSSRGILYAGSDEDFVLASAAECLRLNQEMAMLMRRTD